MNKMEIKQNPILHDCPLKLTTFFPSTTRVKQLYPGENLLSLIFPNPIVN